MDRESLVAKRDAVIEELEVKLGKLKDLNGVIEQIKAAILVDRGRADAIESLIQEMSDEAGETEPSE